MLQIVDWKTGVRFALQSDLDPVVDELTQSCGTQLKCVLRVFGECYEATAETLATMPLAAGYHFQSLTLEDAEEVNNRWEYSHGKTTLPIVQTAIKYFPSVAVHDASGKLVAFELIAGYCNMAILYVYPEHRGRGIGAAITCELAKKMIEIRGKAFLHITTENDISRALHKKCGFIHAGGSTCWQIYVPS